jgi:hypothetical protein
MKKTISILTMILIFTACEDFLDIQPETDFTDDNYWTSEANLKAFSYGCYSVFLGYGTGGYFGGDHFFSVLTDDVISLDPRVEDDFPTTVPSSQSGTQWYWSDIRRTNVLIQGANKAPVDESIRDKYVAIGRLFRAIEYWEKVRTFGDVPFYSEPIESTDEDALYKARDSRVVVVDNIVADLDYAIANLDEVDDKVHVNKWTALALKSRICLAAATTFEYHNVAGSNPAQLYQASYDASKDLIDNGPYSLHSSYIGLFTSEDLGGNSEVILMKKYNENLRHSILSFIFHEPYFGYTLDAVSSFLMTDGKPISYDGGTHPDYTEWIFNPTDTIIRAFTSYDIPVEITANRDRRIKDIIDTTRVVFLFNQGIPMYSPAKYATYEEIESQPTQGVQATSDCPVIRLGEVLLNYAEAAFELGTITQTDLDNTVNLLRARGGVAPLTLAVGFTADDLDPTVDPLLWEIRRERRVELMLEPHRKFDLFRWGKGEYFNRDEAFVGIKPDPSIVFEAGINVLLNPDGYLYTQAPSDRRVPFEDKMYLYPLPSDQITLNSNLVQNTGW